jgi:NTE family protein
MKALTTALLALLFFSLPATAAPREPVALVLAGGGARGIAHVGVITALEEMQVPVDAVAGTSMGALVGGLYAIGMDSDSLQQVIETIDWQEAFEDSVDRDDTPQWRKSDDYDYPSSISLAFKDGKASIPLGFVQGQQVRQMIKELVIEAEHIRDFDALPTPYRAVATDIESGNAYVFDHGDIVTAMRASMSLPGILAPVEHEDRLLVDGGMAMNIPVSVGRDMGGERLIVVDIGTPLKSRDQITSVLGVADQVLGFLTRKNSLEQLATLTERDFLVNPDLTGIGMLDFENTQQIFQSGYDATMAMREQLEPLALDDTEWHAFLASRALPDAENPVVDSIVIENDSLVSNDIIRVRLTQQEGQSLDREQLQADIAAIYALDYWQIIDYELVPGADKRNTLVINASAKGWGEDKLKMGLNMLSDMDGSSEINLGASYLLKGVNRLGAELYGRAQIGDTLLLDLELMQPLDLRSRYFAVAHTGYKDHDVINAGPEFELTDSLGSWRVRRLGLDFELGMNLLANSQIRSGLFFAAGKYKPDIEIGTPLPDERFQEGGAMFSYRYDTLDSVYFPTRGGFLYTDYRLFREELGSDYDFERWQAIGQAAYSFGNDDRNTVILTGRTGQSIDAPNEPQNYFQLGGLFNLSGLGHNFFAGRQMAFAMAQYQRRLSSNSVLPLDLPVFLGASIEGGQLWSERSDVSSGDFINAGSIYLGMDSPLGPIYLAYGRSEDSQDAIYLTLGWPFLSNQTRMGR